MPPTAIEQEFSSTSRSSSRHDEWMPAALGGGTPDYALSSPFDLTIHRHLSRLATLRPNWDSEGANRVDDGIIEAAKELICRLPKSIKGKVEVPAVVPMRKGNLQFEWHDGPRTLELEIENPRTVHYLKWHPEAGIEEENLCPVTDTNTVVGLLEWFAKG
jgi:hypothetical protein